MKNMKDLEKALMSGDSDKEGSPDMMHKAKSEVLKELMHMCKQALMDKTGGDMEEMKKVTVMAPDQENLSEGLDVAKKMSEEMKDPDDIKGFPSDKPHDEMQSEESSAEQSEFTDDEMPSLPGFKKIKKKV